MLNNISKFRKKISPIKYGEKDLLLIVESIGRKHLGQKDQEKYDNSVIIPGFIKGHKIKENKRGKRISIVSPIPIEQQEDIKNFLIIITIIR